ncbi:MAG: ABC-three component system protein [Bacillota bacterium]
MGKYDKDDEYCVERKKPTESQLRLFLTEVDKKCPLCGKTLQKIDQDKPDLKMFEIAHIYPNSPTEQELITLQGCERLGENCESFDNKIALCKDCHNKFDFRKTKAEYEKLCKIKLRLLKLTKIKDSMNDCNLDEQLLEVIENLVTIDVTNIELNYQPIDISKKFNNDESLLKRNVQNYVNDYYLFLKNVFQEKEDEDKFDFELLSQEIKMFFMKVDKESLSDKLDVFDMIVEWMDIKTKNISKLACEIIVSFFIQNCEVFNEIA